ncbi:hypothetical protein ASPZODRAFT_59307 [Penicilliopsis zonata CBS 506.65]|uniref:Uncharacterized protein n=1 Tax=Penicilliopsis zonata CBS 506.65 TaxID=1073090 RepID=A0A1L9SRZ9_9EURO|nr:hypothetical protein ASPZODRAFT_59307 [Penicilliopsis zonata CBS 506.65]OJJ49968.1 hypothetical protein ASPZODRAFT_59307 [Penicilliopsis zonata CBS 506.65]
MSEQTFHLTKEDLRKPESRSSQLHDGRTLKETNVSALKSHIDQNVDKAKIIEERKANLPLPDQPPVASDWQSLDQRTVNIGSGGVEGPLSGDSNSALREPATAGSSARMEGDVLHRQTEPSSRVGRQGHDNLEGLPKDAQMR